MTGERVFYSVSWSYHADFSKPSSVSFMRVDRATDAIRRARECGMPKRPARMSIGRWSA